MIRDKSLRNSIMFICYMRESGTDFHHICLHKIYKKREFHLYRRLLFYSYIESQKRKSHARLMHKASMALLYRIAMVYLSPRWKSFCQRGRKRLPIILADSRSVRDVTPKKIPAMIMRYIAAQRIIWPYVSTAR